MSPRSLILGVALVLMGGLGGPVFLALGCGDEKPEVAPPAATRPVELPAPAPPEPAAEPELLLPRPQAGGCVTGQVTVVDPPKRTKIKMDGDPKCAALHAERPLKDDIVVDGEGHVQWAFVWVKEGISGKYEPPSTPVVLDQKGCHYEPHVLGVMVGQKLEVRNSDDLLHNIHVLPTLNKEFNFGQPSKGMVESKVFTVQEVPIKVKCDIHNWMGAWIAAVNHPFFAVTDASGKYTLQGLPPGKYKVECIQERYLPIVQEIEVKAQESQTLDFKMVDKRE